MSFSKGFSEHPHILAIIKVDSEYSRLPFKLKVDYFILYLILVSTFVIFLLLSSMNKRLLWVTEHFVMRRLSEAMEINVSMWKFRS